MIQDRDGLRKEIADGKQKLDELWYKGNSAKMLGDMEMERRARLELAETVLSCLNSSARSMARSPMSSMRESRWQGERCRR